MSEFKLAASFEYLMDAVESGFAKLAVEEGRNGRREYFTREEAARYLRMSVRKIDSLAAAGEVRRAKLGEGDRSGVLFRRRELDEFVESCLED